MFNVKNIIDALEKNLDVNLSIDKELKQKETARSLKKQALCPLKVGTLKKSASII